MRTDHTTRFPNEPHRCHTLLTLPSQAEYVEANEAASCYEEFPLPEYFMKYPQKDPHALGEYVNFPNSIAPFDIMSRAAAVTFSLFTICSFTACHQYHAVFSLAVRSRLCL